MVNTKLALINSMYIFVYRRIILTLSSTYIHRMKEQMVYSTNYNEHNL
jgi:hypothetical protein